MDLETCVYSLCDRTHNSVDGNAGVVFKVFRTRWNYSIDSSCRTCECWTLMGGGLALGESMRVSQLLALLSEALEKALGGLNF